MQTRRFKVKKEGKAVSRTAIRLDKAEGESVQCRTEFVRVAKVQWSVFQWTGGGKPPSNLCCTMFSIF